MIRFKSLAPLCCLIFSNCAIKTRLPLNHLQSPETTGTKASLDASLIGVATQVITSDKYATNPTSLGPYIAPPEYTGQLGFMKGVIERLDLGARYTIEGPLMVQAKYQWIGDSQVTAKAGNFSLATILGVGGSFDGGDGTSFGTQAKHSIGIVAGEINAVVGYRLADPLLLFGGPFFNINTAQGEITQNSLSTYRVDTRTTQYGVGIGLQVIPVRLVQIAIEAAYSSAQTGITNAPQFTVGANISFLIGKLPKEKN